MKKNSFTRKKAREIADISFCYLLDCMMGYSDTGYDLSEEASYFEQNFEEDLEKENIPITPYKIKIISEEFDKLKKEFENYVRKKYYKKT